MLLRSILFHLHLGKNENRQVLRSLVQGALAHQEGFLEKAGHKPDMHKHLHRRKGEEECQVPECKSMLLVTPFFSGDLNTHDHI